MARNVLRLLREAQATESTMARSSDMFARDTARLRSCSFRPASRWTPPSVLRRLVVVVGILLVSQWSCVGRPKPPNNSEPPPSAPSVDLHLASLQGNIGVVRKHVALGTNLNARDAYGSTPLTVAATFGRSDVVKTLLNAGADPNLTDRQGSAPLHIAAFLGHPDIVRALLEHGAAKRARNFTGATAFDIVAVPFDPDRAVYDGLAAALGPLGLHLDYAQIKASRPAIAELLKARPEELAKVNYAPAERGDFPVSTPAEQGLPPQLVAELFVDARAVEKLVGLVVVKNGRLIAEGYYNEGLVEHSGALQSVTKSVTSALVGLALDRGCLANLDQKMLEFFPAQAERVNDLRKREITIRQMLQMRAGYPWEETDPKLWQVLTTGKFFDPILNFALVNAPGEAFNYSNLTSHWLGVIVARACKTDLNSFAEQNLFSRLGIQAGTWYKDYDGYYVGLAGLHLTARDMAKFGLLYLDRGSFAGERVLPAAWVEESLRNYSKDAWISKPPQHHAGRYFRELGYGYQWWSATVENRRFNFAWGHGGQLIVLLDDLDMVIVAMSYPFQGQHDDESWRHERATINLVGKFIQSLPSE